MINNILRRPPWRSSVLCIAVGLALSACAVGPDFHAPEAPKVADAGHPYTPAPLPAMPATLPVDVPTYTLAPPVFAANIDSSVRSSPRHIVRSKGPKRSASNRNAQPLSQSTLGRSSNASFPDRSANSRPKVDSARRAVHSRSTCAEASTFR